jgi:hypothetical protein
VVDPSALDQIGNSDVSIMHLCEGRKSDPITRREFEVFLEWAQAHPEQARKLILIHLVGLQPGDFQKLAALGINRAVWSPSSNLMNYGETMNVEAAIRAGFKIALDPDWYPTSCPTRLRCWGCRTRSGASSPEPWRTSSSSRTRRAAFFRPC